MSNMVEWKKLGDIMSIVRGASPRPIKNYITNDPDGINWIKIGDVSPNAKYITTTAEKITREGAAKSRHLNVGDFILSNSMSFGRPYILKTDGCIHDGWIAMSDFEKIISSGYLYEVLNSELVQKYWKKKANDGGAMSNLNSDIVRGTIIPIPSLTEQERIVSILDTFTASIENIKEQIAQRRKQYACLIDECFGGNYKSMMGKAEAGEIIVEPLSKHGTFTRGRRFVRTDIVEEGQPCIHYGDMYTYYGLCADKAKTHLPCDFPKKMRYAETGDVVIVGAGENNEDIGVGLVWQGKEPAAVHDACYIYKTDLNPMYISYFLRSGIYHLQIKSNVVRGKICSISSDGIGRALIPVYPIEKQQKIVEMLMPFESLLSNLQEQLELRQKQYEHYRNKLLTFA